MNDKFEDLIKEDFQESAIVENKYVTINKIANIKATGVEDGEPLDPKSLLFQYNSSDTIDFDHMINISNDIRLKPADHDIKPVRLEQRTVIDQGQTLHQAVDTDHKVLGSLSNQLHSLELNTKPFIPDVNINFHNESYECTTSVSSEVRYWKRLIGPILTIQSIGCVVEKANRANFDNSEYWVRGIRMVKYTIVCFGDHQQVQFINRSGLMLGEHAEINYTEKHTFRCPAKCYILLMDVLSQPMISHIPSIVL